MCVEGDDHAKAPGRLSGVRCIIVNEGQGPSKSRAARKTRDHLLDKQTAAGGLVRRIAIFKVDHQLFGRSLFDNTAIVPGGFKQLVKVSVQLS